MRAHSAQCQPASGSGSYSYEMMEPNAAAVALSCRSLLGVTSSHEQRVAAEAYLAAVRKPSPAAWAVLVEVVGTAYEQPVRCFAAQTLRAHAQRGRDPPPHAMTRDSLGLLAAEHERPVMTQLCLAAAAAASRATEWAVSDVLARLTSAPLDSGVVLELVRLLPEELDEKRLSVNPQRRKELRAALRASTAELSGWLAAACGAADDSGTGAPEATVRAAFGCLTSWLRAELVPSELAGATPLLGLALRTVLAQSEGCGAVVSPPVLSDATREAAADVICGAVAVEGGGVLGQVRWLRWVLLVLACNTLCAVVRNCWLWLAVATPAGAVGDGLGRCRSSVQQRGQR